jgi:hypothetical protein
MENKAYVRAYGRKRAKKVTIHDVWAGFAELREIHAETDRLMKKNAAEADKRMKENAAEADKRMKELAESIKASAAETDRLMKESAAEADRRFKETDRIVKENGRQLGDVHNRLGELIEHIVLPNIMEKVKPLGYKFKHIRKRYEFTDKNYRVIAEADVLLINSEYLMIVEVKTVLKAKDIDSHLKRLERIRREACPPDDSHKFIGCVAGAVVDESVKKYAHKKGLYVIEQSGDTLRLDVPEGFTPAVW